MLNWRRIAVTGLVAGMVAVTGCSTNLPETNQANRNGQRVVDSVNRRTDTYRGTGIERDGVMGRTTRGIRRAAHNVTNPTNSTTRSTTRNTSRNNSLNIGRPQGRVGNTFRYGSNRGRTTGLHNSRTGGYNYGTHRGSTTGLNTNRVGDYSCYDNYNCDIATNGYDYGASATDRAVVSSRTTRNTTTAPAVTPSTEKTETKRIDTKRKATPDKPVKSSKPEAKKQEVKKAETNKAETNKTEAVTRSAVAAPAVPNTNATPRPTHRANRANVSHATRSHTNRVEKNNVQTRNNQVRHIAPNATPVPNTNVAPKKKPQPTATA
jgi:hypothetical protein